MTRTIETNGFGFNEPLPLSIAQDSLECVKRMQERVSRRTAVLQEILQRFGQGMGPELNTASGLNAYILADRGTWLNFKNRGALTIVVGGDKRLFNQYGVMLVSPAKHPQVKQDLGQKFIDWLVSRRGQQVIASYKINGEQLFFPNAGTDS